MKIGIDIDGVLRDFVGELKRVYKIHNPDWIDVEITDYDLTLFFGEGIYDFMYKRHWSIFLSAKLLGDGEPWGSARVFCQILKSTGHNLFFISTQPYSESLMSTIDWMNHNLFGFDPYKTNYPIQENLIFTKHKELFTNLDVLIDDCTENLEKARAAGIYPICFKQSYNEDFTGFRSNNYNEILEQIKVIEREKQDDD
jgi:5'(3')-deoxyribonucleotidase